MAKQNKNTIYLIVLIALIGFYLLFKFVIKPAPDSNFDLNALSVDTSRVAAITIKQPSKKAIKLSQIGEKWNVSQADKTAEADIRAVKGIHSVLADMKIQNIAATSPDKWKEFHLTDSLATEVQLFDKSGKIIKDFYLGKFSYKQNKNPYERSYGNNVTGLTYVRLAGKNESFIVNGFLPMSFTREFNSFRNQTVLHLNKNDIDKIVFDYPADTGFVVSKKDSLGWFVNNTDSVDRSKVSQYLNSISTIRESNFDDSFKPANKAKYTITYSGKNISDITVKVYQKDSANYILNSSQNPKTFFESSSKNVKRLMQSAKYFKK